MSHLIRAACDEGLKPISGLARKSRRPTSVCAMPENIRAGMRKRLASGGADAFSFAGNACSRLLEAVAAPFNHGGPGRAPTRSALVPDALTRLSASAILLSDACRPDISTHQVIRRLGSFV